jgi:uncharacterized protein (DUF302 family)
VRLPHCDPVANDDTHGIVTLDGYAELDELLRRAVAHIEASGLDVVAVIDHSGDAYDAGLAMPETKLVLFGSPEVTTRLILAHPRIALDLPLKLLISERDDGQVSVSYNAPDPLAQPHGLADDEANELRIVETIARTIWRTT